MKRPPQGEALAVWALLAADVLAILVVYAVLDVDDLYNVSKNGVEGGLSRALVQLNFPSVAGTAIALTLLALAALPRRAWLVGAPAIALCAVLAWPGVLEQGDLDAKVVNALPALGVALAATLTVAAARRAGFSFAPRRSFDLARVAVAVAVVVLSLPWIAAELGFHLPGDVFLGEELYTEDDGRTFAAVHLGHHHGGDGTLLVLSALLLSRARPWTRTLRLVYTSCVGLMLAYGGVNLAQDLWHEQVVKRGWTEVGIPSALYPGLRPVWLVIVVLAVLATAVLLREEGDAAVDPVPA